MIQIIQPSIVDCQQLIVVSKESNIYAMVNKDEKVLFSKRLEDLCDEKRLPVNGRQQTLKTICGTTQQAVSKWFLGEAIPKHEFRIVLCDYFNVRYEWLLTGRGEKRDGPAEFVSEREIQISEFSDLLRKLSDSDFHQVTGTGENLARYLLRKKSGNGEDEE